MTDSVESASCPWAIGWKPMPRPDNETLRLRTERKLEDCRTTDAFEQNALHAHRARSHHRDCRRDTHGHCHCRNPGWVRQEHGHLRRRRALCLAMAVETGR